MNKISHIHMFIYEEIQLENSKLNNLNKYMLKIRSNNCKDILQLIQLHANLKPDEFSMHNLIFNSLSKEEILLINNVCESIKMINKLED